MKRKVVTEIMFRVFMFVVRMLWKERFIDFYAVILSPFFLHQWNFVSELTHIRFELFPHRHCSAAARHVVVIVLTEFIVSVGSILIRKLWKTQSINFLPIDFCSCELYSNGNTEFISLRVVLLVVLCNFLSLCSRWLADCCWAKVSHWNFRLNRANLTAHKSHKLHNASHEEKLFLPLCALI